MISIFGGSGDGRFEVDSRGEGLSNIEEQFKALARAQNQASYGFERSPVKDDTPWNLLQNYIDYYLRFRGLRSEESRKYAEHVVDLVRSGEKDAVAEELELILNGSKGRPQDQKLAEVLHRGIQKLYSV